MVTVLPAFLFCNALLVAIHASWRLYLSGILTLWSAVYLAIDLAFAGLRFHEGTLVALLLAGVYPLQLHRLGARLRPWLLTIAKGATAAPAAGGGALDALLGRHAVIDSVSADGVIRFRLVGWRARALIAYRLAQIAVFFALILWHDQLLTLVGQALGRYLRIQFLGR